MSAQRLGCGEVTRQFRLRQGRVDLLVAEMVEEHRWPMRAALHLGDEVMEALGRVLGDDSPAERADGIGRWGQGLRSGLGEADAVGSGHRGKVGAGTLRGKCGALVPTVAGPRPDLRGGAPGGTAPPRQVAGGALTRDAA